MTCAGPVRTVCNVIVIVPCDRLWVMTVNALQPSVKILHQQRYSQNDLMVDPLIVLRCDQRVYRYTATMHLGGLILMLFRPLSRAGQQDGISTCALSVISIK